MDKSPEKRCSSTAISTLKKFLIITPVVGIILCGRTTAMAHTIQMPLSSPNVEPVPGLNGDAVFCTVPRSEQLFQIEFLDVAPLPMPVYVCHRHYHHTPLLIVNSDQIFFTYLRGQLKEGVTGLEDAQLRFTSSGKLPSGDLLEPRAATIPLATFTNDGIAHLTVRYPGGRFGGPLQPGANEILTDYWFPAQFMQSGDYTFKIEAFLPGTGEETDKYLFAFELSQWLSGRMNRA